MALPEPMKADRKSTVTNTPPTPPPQLFCPSCEKPLIYRQTVIGGLQPPERWDQFHCSTCGPFEYRARTRQLRPVARH